LVQFGISYSKDQALQRLAKTQIPDDPPKGIPFNKGTISYAGRFFFCRVWQKRNRQIASTCSKAFCVCVFCLLVGI
jgi:hypothetical protein